jgi:hypothetical protein
LAHVGMGHGTTTTKYLGHVLIGQAIRVVSPTNIKHF